MNIDNLLKHHGINDNPFAAEEARLDPVFDRLLAEHPTHPDYTKILGRIDRPSTAVVMGEKGSGKTAIRMMLARDILKHNQAHPDKRVLLVPYDDLNPVLDHLLQARHQAVDELPSQFRLADHQDAILSLAVTRLVDALLGQQATEEEDRVSLSEQVDKQIRQMPRQRRTNLAVLAALYDQPQSDSLVNRWQRLRRVLRLGWSVPLSVYQHGAATVTLIALMLAIWRFVAGDDQPLWLMPMMGMTIALAVLAWGYWAWRWCKLWRLGKRVVRDMPAVDRSSSELRSLLGQLPPADLARQPLPGIHSREVPASDSRYQLTRQLLDSIAPLGYVGLCVLVDRVDEPTLISGDPKKMQAVIWPMLDNKFLKQSQVGIKLLLPIELRHALMRESAGFFQEARLDKQNLIDRLQWSGATLYDLCSSRLQACRDGKAEDASLTLRDLFEEDVSRDLVIDALDQMQQPRDAFKFIYAVLQEHCRMVPEDQPVYRIPRLTLETVRRNQAQRVQDLHRGLSPA